MNKHIVKYIAIISLALFGAGCSAPPIYNIGNQMLNEVQLDGRYSKLDRSIKNSEEIVIYLGKEFDVDAKYVSALGENCMILNSKNESSSIIVCENKKGWYRINSNSSVARK